MMPRTGVDQLGEVGWKGKSLIRHEIQLLHHGRTERPNYDKGKIMPWMILIICYLINSLAQLSV